MLNHKKRHLSLTPSSMCSLLSGLGLVLVQGEGGFGFIAFYRLLTAAPSVFFRPASGAGGAREADGREQDVGPQLPHSGRCEERLSCSGLTVSACHASVQNSGQRLCQPDRSLTPAMQQVEPLFFPQKNIFKHCLNSLSN